MKIPVHMLAFSETPDVVRMVDVPDEEVKSKNIPDPLELLELVFKYGQNEIQPAKMPSVSVGDVVELFGEYWMVASTGFDHLTAEQFFALQPPTSMYAYEKSIKKSLGI